KPWVEYSRGKPITDRGVADLLHEYQIVSKAVGPKDARAKGYRKADFIDAWERYLSPTGEEKKEAASEPDILPFTRSPDCNHSGKAETFAVHQGGGERQKNDRFSNDINAVNGRTAKKEVLTARSFSSSPRSVQRNTAKPHTSPEKSPTVSG